MHISAHVHELAIWISNVLKGNLSVPGVALVLALISAIWLLAALSLRGLVLALWLLVPVLLAVASVAVAGPGRLFSKEGHEGAVILTFSPRNAMTTLDLFGLVCFLLAVGLAVTSVYLRHRQAAGRH